MHWNPKFKCKGFGAPVAYLRKRESSSVLKRHRVEAASLFLFLVITSMSDSLIEIKSENSQGDVVHCIHLVATYPGSRTV